MLAVVFLGGALMSWTESWPLMALSQLFQELDMGVPDITNYEAVVFLPWCLKPLYGLLADSVRIHKSHRRAYILLTTAGSAACYLATGLLVRSQAELYVVSLVRTACEAFLQLLLGAVLVDVAQDDLSKATSLQSYFNAALWLGTLAAQGMYYFYARGSQDFVPNARRTISMTAVAPALLAILCLLKLPETAEHVEERSVGSEVKFERRKFFVVIALLQANLILISCRSLMAEDTFSRAIFCSFVLSVGLIGIVFHKVVKRSLCPEAAAEYARTQDEICFRWGRLAVFLFLVGAIPTSTVALGQAQFMKFRQDELTEVNILGSVCSCFAALAFAGTRRIPGLRRVFAICAVVAAAAVLVWLPFAKELAEVDGKVSVHSRLGALLVMGTISGSVASLWTVLPVDTCITAASGQLDSQQKATAYGTLLSFYASGATAGGFIASPIVQYLGLDSKSWAALPEWIVVTVPDLRNVMYVRHDFSHVGLPEGPLAC
eukprot:TRINITY_DN26669_c0_g1_i1.p1 TRINITY_DN26669_c0_g1~~TRINITY_DN26669_c0_g1_i1.p1  ORF type:complete len:490 (+),score=81.38 TRINITY_DN26669_c0_g1_i1:91-1560(+)